MSDLHFLPEGTGAGIVDPLASQADKVMRQAKAADCENRRIETSAREFEALLLTNWLQHAYETFGTVPGGDEETDLSSGNDQFQAIAMQSLGEAISSAGGIGIAKMIADRLQRDPEPRNSAMPPNLGMSNHQDRGGKSSLDRGKG